VLELRQVHALGLRNIEDAHDTETDQYTLRLRIAVCVGLDLSFRLRCAAFSLCGAAWLLAVPLLAVLAALLTLDLLRFMSMLLW
jgi:hypothetical protein